MAYILSNRIILITLIISLALIFLGASYKTFFTQASFSGILKATVSVTPLALEIESPSKVFIGENFKLKALFTNKGNVIIENMEANIFLPLGISSYPKESKKLGNLPPRREKEVIWVLRGEGEGNHIILVSGKGALKDSGDLVEIEKSITIEVEKQGFLGRKVFPQIFKPLLDFFLNLW